MPVSCREGTVTGSSLNVHLNASCNARRSEFSISSDILAKAERADIHNTVHHDAAWVTSYG